MFDDLHPLSCDPLMLHGFFDDRDDPSAQLKSIVVAQAHEFCFDFEFALHLIRSRNTIGSRPIEGLSRLDFLELLEFREHEICRVIGGGDPSWDWPASWKPSWNSHVTSCVGSDLDTALALTRQAQAVQKTLLGHGSYAALDEPVTMRMQALVGILLEGRHFAPLPRFPLILSSYERPALDALSECHWDFDNILGEYRRPSRSHVVSSDAHHQIFLHERALTACSESLAIERRILRVIVILHECAHFFVDRLPSTSPKGTGWVDSGYGQTSQEVHETIAQILTFWACQDSWLREPFEKLNARQSHAYRRFKDDLEAGVDRSSVVAAIAKIRKLDSGADIREWKAALGI